MAETSSTSRIALTPLTRYRTLAASLACFWTLHFIVLWSSTFAIDDPQSPFGLSHDLTWLIAIVCNALVLLTCFLKLKRNVELYFDRIAMAAGIATAVGIACIALRVAQSGTVFDGLYLIGTALFGGGTGLLMTCYADRLCKVTPQSTFMLFTAAFFVGAVLCLLVSAAFVPTAAWVVTALLPVVASVLYGQSARAARSDVPALSDRPSPMAATDLPPKSLFFLIAIIGLSAGLVRETGYGTTGAPLPDYLFIGSVMVGGALLFTLSFFVNHLKPTLILQVVVVIISGALLAGALAAGPTSPIAFVIYTLGFLFFVAFVWLFCTYVGNNRTQGARLFVGGLLANQAGQALGSIAFLGMLAAFGPEGTLGLPISLAMLYVLLIAALVFFANAGRSKYGSASQASTTPPKEMLQRMASPYRLTAREAEIGALVAEGLSRADIAERLIVSQETVKTHTKHLYQKLDVHSRAELLSLLQQEAARESSQASLM